MIFFEADELKNNEMYLCINRTTDAVPEKNWVPAYYFDICLNDGTMIGFCDLRIGHNSSTYIGGNIGYTIYEDFRGHHYAEKACRLMFPLAKKHEMDYLIITNDIHNIASLKTCENLGAKLLEIKDVPINTDLYQSGTRKVRVYRLDL